MDISISCIIDIGFTLYIYGCMLLAKIEMHELISPTVDLHLKWLSSFGHK